MLIHQVMSQRGWQPQDVLFVDDSSEHIKGAQAVCRTMQVARKGVTEKQMQQMVQMSQGSGYELRPRVN